jgi:hypothetical protein
MHVLVISARVIVRVIGCIVTRFMLWGVPPDIALNVNFMSTNFGAPGVSVN